MVLFRSILLMILACAALPAAARVYCCIDEQGRKVCGDILPVQCQTRAYDVLNAQGIVKQKVEAPLTPQQRAERDAELARQKIVERAIAEQARRDRAILTSYASVDDIDAKRARTVVAAQAEINGAHERLTNTQTRREELRQRAARYDGKPLPSVLQANLQDIDAEVVARQAALDELEKELEAILIRFDQDRRRYLELTSKNTATSSAEPAAANR
jgi:hypothetical protein